MYHQWSAFVMVTGFHFSCRCKLHNSKSCIRLKCGSRYQVQEILNQEQAVAVVARQNRMRDVLAPYAKKDQWNFDECVLFAFASPDRGRATQQMSDKSRITFGFACNADGSEKMPLVAIGSSSEPRCFGKVPPSEKVIHYRNNKQAQMTPQLFEEWVRFLQA